MRLTPEVLPMLQLPIFRLTLLTSLAFGALSAVVSAPLTAQTTSIPNLSGYDSQTRQSMELACISDKTNGPAPYAACLNRQIASLQSSHGIPNLSGYDSQTRQSMELACISDKTNGPAPYAACLNRQIASLQSSPGIPNLSGYDNQTRQSMELACISDKTNGPAPYAACLNRQIASLQGSPSIPNSTSEETAVHSVNGSGTDVAPQVKDGWLQVSEDMSFRVDSMKMNDKEISMLMQTKMDDGQVHYNIVAIPYTVCSQGYGKIRFYDLKHVFVYGADAALNGNSRGSFVATMLCAVRSEAIKPK